MGEEEEMFIIQMAKFKYFAKVRIVHNAIVK